MEILHATADDLPEILALQKLAYQSEAMIYNDFDIAPLTQTPEELEEEFNRSTILNAVDDGRIVGSVRAYERDGTCHIGRLIVHPDRQNQGMGRKLVDAIEECFRGRRYELFTGCLSVKNLAFYEKLGYRKYKTDKIDDKLELVYLEK